MMNTKLWNHWGRALAWMEQSDYRDEIKRFREIRPAAVDRDNFFKTYAHVVLAAGYKYKNLMTLCCKLNQAFRNYEIDAINESPEQVRRAALDVIDLTRKVNPIICMAQYLASNDWEQFKARLTGSSHLQEMKALGGIGKINKYQLARNIGLDYAKPDVLLRRVAKEFGYTGDESGVFAMVRAIQEPTGERPGVIDIILWRYEEQHRPAG